MYRAAALRKRQHFQQMMDEMDAEDRYRLAQTRGQATEEPKDRASTTEPPSTQPLLASTRRKRGQQPKRPVGARPPPRRSLFAVFVTTLVISLAVRLLRPKPGLPHNYALCSTENNIYTVDERKPRVECIVVRGRDILDTGSIGWLYFQSDLQNHRTGIDCC